MKNYIYIPLGGNKLGQYHTYLNLFIVFFISGLWHGASWNFVLWGIFHGIFIVSERLFLIERVYKYVPKLVSVLVSFFIVINGWVLFRTEKLSEAFSLYQKLYTYPLIKPTLLSSKESFFIYSGLCVCMLFLYAPILKFQDELYKIKEDYLTLAYRFLILVLLITTSISFISANDFNPFIYFRF